MKTYLPYMLLLFGVLALRVEAVTTAELQAMLATNESVTLIDLRSQEAFEAGTLPDAMRMTAREAAQKPFKGLVVFFDDGLGIDLAGKAAVALASKNNEVQADKLIGGFAAWRGVGGSTSERKGLSYSQQNYVSYQQLSGVLTDQADDIVLLDLRSASPAKAMTALELAGGTDAAVQSAVDLTSEFPQYTVTRTLPQSAAAVPSAASPGQLAAAPEKETSPLYVLIDAGDGTSEKVEKTLKASGLTRVVILAGGENIIKRKGEPGLLRRGSGTGLDEEQDGSSDFATVVEEEAKP
ncbi:MAG: hypothetical protein PF904_16600 [Kiritimatiellae bacterium]|jgi:rhodanese-related sulfurtransferase|nr:hypothetical protein [Kiritimatiellia bacterium]